MKATLLLICALIALAGCSFKGGFEPALPSDAQAWLSKPVTMRVYPASRFIEEQGQTLLALRVELFDEAGDSTKGSGEYRFELFEQLDERDQSIGKQLYAWPVPVLTLAQNKQHFDPVTRSYLFRLRIADRALVQQPTVVRVWFVSAEGGRMEAQAALPPAVRSGL